MDDEVPTIDARLILAGVGFLALAYVCWEVRDFVPSLAARSVTATAEVMTMSERDDARVFRAFASARRGPSSEAGLEPLPKRFRDIRETRLWVRAPAETDALAELDQMSGAMRKAFESEGKGEIRITARRRTTPVANDTMIMLGRVLRGATLLLLLAGLGTIRQGWKGASKAMEATGPPVDPVVKFAIGYMAVLLLLTVTPRGTTLPFLPAPMNAVSSWAVLMLVMTVPTLILFVMSRKMREVKQASHWSVGRARITKSEVKSERHRHVEGVTQVGNMAQVAYEFPVGSQVYQGSRIGIGETMGPEVEAVMKRYPVGASVPVYYDPDHPDSCVLERDAPVNAGCLYAIALAVVLGGLSLAAVFLFPEGFLRLLEPYFPAGAHPHLAIFFAVAGLMMLLMQWGSRRLARQAASWPQVEGRVVRSETESFLSRSGQTHGPRVRLYEPVIEYAYRVEGREYHSAQLSFGGELASGNRAGADETVARYPVGSAVQVHYDPQNPSQAVIDLKVALALPGLALAAVFLVLAAFFGGAFGAHLGEK